MSVTVPVGVGDPPVPATVTVTFKLAPTLTLLDAGVTVTFGVRRAAVTVTLADPLPVLYEESPL